MKPLDREPTKHIDRQALLKKLSDQRDSYVGEHGSFDHSTGATEFSKAKQEYLNYLDETIDEIENFPFYGAWPQAEPAPAVAEDVVERAQDVISKVMLQLGYVTCDPSIAQALANVGLLRQPAAVPEWLPIESAPKDGSVLILQMPFGVNGVRAFWCKYAGHWILSSPLHVETVLRPVAWRPAAPSPNRAPALDVKADAEELLAALKPFAEAASDYEKNDDDETVVIHFFKRIVVSDLRRTRAIIAKVER